MFLKTPGSTEHKIYRNLYTVHIPKKPDNSEIANWGLATKDQYWRRTKLPDFYEERRLEEAYKQAREQELVDRGEMTKIKHFDKVLENFRRKEWKKRIYGTWFMNAGQPVYITGEHYFFLNWCKFDHEENDGYPVFYEHQVERFYFRELCVTDPYCLGYILIGPRGFGKTSEEVAGILNAMTMPSHRRVCAIQSKSERDAINVIFQNKMVPVYNELPHFFKPVQSHGTSPKQEMTFSRASVTGKSSKLVQFGEEYELNNRIYCVPAKEKTLDGETLSIIMTDEIGKTDPKKEADVYKRNQVNVRCVFRNRRKTGIIRATSTVEEMDKGGHECHKIWLESDPLKRDDTGRTISRLYKYFVDAVSVRVDFADQHGRVDKKAAYEDLMNERKALQNNPDALASSKRKDPLTEDEAFIPPQNVCMFDVHILTDRKKELNMLEFPLGKNFQLDWVEEDKEVTRRADPNGPFTIYHMHDYNEGMLYNAVHRRVLNSTVRRKDPQSGKYLFYPRNADLGRIGLDPIKTVKTKDPRASKMGAFAHSFYDANIDHGKDMKEWESYKFLWKYHYRHNDPDIDNENMIKAMFYWGMPIMVENNTTDFTKHVISRGYTPFLIGKKDFSIEDFNKSKTSKSGEYHTSTEEVINSYVKAWRTYVVRHGHRIPDIDLIDQLIRFDPKNITEFDLAVGGGYNLLALLANFSDPFESEEELHNELNEIWRKYDVN